MEDNAKIDIGVGNLEALIKVGLALSTEKELNSFFQVVLDSAQNISGADAGAVLLKVKDQLHFMVMNNNTFGIRPGKESKPISIPPVPMEESYVAAYVALRGIPLKIDDIYKTDLFDFEGPKKYDKITGYHTQSILVVPMCNQNNEAVGVIEMINAKDQETGEVIPFSEKTMNILRALASQAAVAFERAQTMRSLEDQLVRIQGLQKSEEELNRKLRDAFQKLETKNQKLEEAVKNIKSTRYYTAVFILTIVITGAWIYNKNFEFSLERIKNLTNNEKIVETPVFEQTAIVERDMVIDSITLTGTLEPLQTVHITSPIEGAIKETHFNYGEKVKKGEPLVTLKSSALEIGYRDAQAEFLKQQAELQKLLDWESSVEIANARRSLKTSKLEYEKQQSNLIQVENLYKKDIVARQEVEQANRQVINAEGQYESSKEQLKLISNKKNLTSLTIARHRLENAKVKLISFEENLSKVIIPVPVAGIVMSAKNGRGSAPKINVGHNVKSGQLLMSIGDLSGFSIKTKVDEVDILKIKKGQSVWVTGDAFPKNRLKGFVRMVSSQAEVSRGRGNRPFFSVIVDVNKIDPKVQEKLFIGMSANLRIITYKNPHAMVLPVESVQLRGKIAYTNVKTEDGIKKVKLRIGITSPRNIEIKSGLKEGDKVVY